MKKSIALLLAALTLLSLFSCNHAPHETTDADSAAESDYADVLAIYRKVVDILPAYVDDKNADETYATELGIAEEDRDVFSAILYSSYLYYPGRGAEDAQSARHKLVYGYATEDLNRDGTSELILMQEDGTVIALFSLSDGEPVLLGNYWNRSSCRIGADGRIHLYGSGGADVFSHAVTTVADDGKALETIEEFGADGHEWAEDGTARTIYYRRIDGAETRITEEEYRALSDLYAAGEASGLGFVLLFDDADLPTESPTISLEEARQIASDYWGIKPGDVDEETGYTFSILPKDGSGTGGCYVIALSWLVEESHYSTLETIEIDPHTGEVLAPSQDEGK